MQKQLPFTFEEFRAIYSKVPRLCVDLVVMHQGKYLLTLRTKDGYEGLWHLPGGTVYYHESVIQAVKRIAKEEIGLDIEVGKCLGYIEFPDEIEMKGFGHSVSIPFLCRTSSIDISLDDHAEKADFFSSPPKNTVLPQKKFLESLNV